MDKINVQLLLLDGESSKRIKATTSPVDIVAYKIPRDMLSACENSKEEISKHLSQTAIYLLFGRNSEGKQGIYVGQASERDNGKGILQRLKEHHKNNKDKYLDYWNEVIVITTPSNSLGQTEIKHLERYFYDEAKKTKRYEIYNSNTPSPGTLTEGKKAELGSFIHYSKLLVGILGHNVFEPTNETKNIDPAKKINSDIPTFTYQGSLKAYLQIISKDEYVLLKGSEIRNGVTNTGKKKNIDKLRDQYSNKIRNNKLIEDIVFTSSSTAAELVAGNTASGNVSWKTADGRCPKDFGY